MSDKTFGFTIIFLFIQYLLSLKAISFNTYYICAALKWEVSLVMLNSLNPSIVTIP